MRGEFDGRISYPRVFENGFDNEFVSSMLYSMFSNALRSFEVGLSRTMYLKQKWVSKVTDIDCQQ